MPSRDKSLQDKISPKVENSLLLNVVVLGASGDLAKKKTFPALFALFQKE